MAKIYQESKLDIKDDVNKNMLDTTDNYLLQITQLTLENKEIFIS